MCKMHSSDEFILEVIQKIRFTRQEGFKVKDILRYEDVNPVSVQTALASEVRASR